MHFGGKPLKKQRERAESFLDLFLNFVNYEFPEDLEGSHFITMQSEFVGLLYGYTGFLCQFRDRYPFLNRRSKQDQYVGYLTEVDSPQIYKERLDLFRKLQEHLHSKLEIITDGPSNGVKRPQLVQRAGTRRFFIDFEKDCFVESFWPKGADSDGELNLGQEKALAEAVFADMLREEALMPSRLKRCKRCGNFFYQHTAKERLYCSSTCSSYTQQQKFRKRAE